MSEELLQRDLKKNPEKIGSWDYYNIGSTTINQLKEAGIIRSVDYGDLGRKKVDGIIVKQKEVIAIIEHKHPRSFNTESKKNSAILQEIEVAKILKSKLIIATDGQESIWVNVDTGNTIKDGNGLEIKFKFNSKDEKLQDFIKEILNSINNHNDKILPNKVVNPTDLAKQIWQDIWSVSGATPENSLYSFVELFIFKYISDLGILTGDLNFKNLIKKYENNSVEYVLDFYAKFVRPEIKELFPENPLDKTTIINGAVFVDKDQKSISRYGLVFKKILEKFENYGELNNIDHDFKSKLFESFLKESISKKNWGQFFTPIKVVKAVNKMAISELREGMKICDPACGVGKFPLEFIKERIGEFFSIDGNKIKQKIQIIGFDKGFDEGEQKTIILAKANMLIYFCDLIKENKGMTREFSELFNNTFILKTKSVLGTLSETIRDEYDLILTNPPYVTSGVSNLKNEISSDLNLKEYYKISATGVEGLFMEWIVRSLKPNGKAFIIIPDGILDRSSDKNLRRFILDNCYLDAIISLPINTFFTTQKKTSILAITKKFNIANKQETPVFTYLVSEIGESRDVNRFDIDQDDLKEAVELFNFYKGNKRNFQDFQRLKPDLRCKLWDIEKFEPEKNWSVDRWWKREELVNLGIEEKESVVDIDTFCNLINNVSDKLKLFSESINKDINNNKINRKKISIGEIFDLSFSTNSSFFTKSFVEENKGEIPVYSASKDENSVDYGYVKDNLDSVKYFDNCLTLNIFGSVGKIFLRKGRFSISENVMPLILKKSYESSLDKLYLKYVFEKELMKESFGFTNKIGKYKIINIEIEIPIDDNGNYDLEKQKKIAKKYREIEETKKKIKIEFDNVNKQVVNLWNCQINRKKISIGEIFDLSKSENNGSKITKSFVEENKGEIPVYGASKEEISDGYGKIKDNLPEIKYFENCLTWNKNGSVGKVFFRKERFTLSTDVMPLIVYDIYKNSLSLLYLKFVVENELMNQGFNFSNKAGKDKIREIEVEIPINLNGDFDLSIQEEFARKYIDVDNIKSWMKGEFEKIEKIKIEINSL